MQENINNINYHAARHKYTTMGITVKTIFQTTQGLLDKLSDEFKPNRIKGILSDFIEIDMITSNSKMYDAAYIEQSIVDYVMANKLYEISFYKIDGEQREYKNIGICVNAKFNIRKVLRFILADKGISYSIYSLDVSGGMFESSIKIRFNSCAATKEHIANAIKTVIDSYISANAASAYPSLLSSNKSSTFLYIVTDGNNTLEINTDFSCEHIHEIICNTIGETPVYVIQPKDKRSPLHKVICLNIEDLSTKYAKIYDIKRALSGLSHIS